MTMPTLSEINCAIALAGFFALLCVAHRMTRATSHAFRGAIVLLGVALFGQAIGDALGLWRSYLDTMLYCGILALFLADARRHDVGSRWAACASLGAQAIGWAAFLIAPALGLPAE